jgi:hypothetical protein
LAARRELTRQHLSAIAGERDRWIDDNAYYYYQVARLLRFLVEPGKRVLSVRCITGLFLAAVRPGYGKGIEISSELLDVARRKHPEFSYEIAFPDTDSFCRAFEQGEQYDYIIFGNIDDTVDVQRALVNLKPLCHRHTRLIIVTYNPLWEPLVALAQALRLKVPQTEQNWLSGPDIENLLTLTGYEWLKTYRTVLVPKYLPIASGFLNRFVARLPLFNRLCMTEAHVARLLPTPLPADSLSVSVVIPCKDERGNIEAAVRRIPFLGRDTEIIFCDDRSRDGTGAEVERVKNTYLDRNIRLLEGPGISKARNVWTGFDAAAGDVLVILDADLTTMPEELTYFLEAIASGTTEFVNGSRLIYPVPETAMKGANMIGNKLFSMVFSYLLSQRVKDTLCGTKVLWRKDWERMKPFVGSWGTEDRWGDYELLFGAAKLNLRIMDLPVHYQERIYGTTKMTRVVKNGLVMLRMCWQGFLRLKLGY